MVDFRKLTERDRRLNAIPETVIPFVNFLPLVPQPPITPIPMPVPENPYTPPIPMPVPENPYTPPIPIPVPEKVSGLGLFYESGGLGVGGVPGYTGGPISGEGNYTTGSGTSDGNYTVTPVGLVGDLTPQTYSEPINVRSASTFFLTGAQPTVPANNTNPFQRPKSQEGIGSLAGG